MFNKRSAPLILARRTWLKLAESRLFRNTGWMMAGQIGGYLLQAVYFIALSRLLGAVQFGIFVGAFSFASIVAPYSSLGTGVVFVRYVSGNPNLFRAYWGNILVVTTGMSALLIAVLYPAATHLLNPLSAALVPLAAVANCFCGQLTTETGRIFQAYEELHATAFLNLMISLLRTMVVTAMLLALHHGTAWQWAIASTCISLAGSAIAVGCVTHRFGLPAFEGRLVGRRAAEGFGYAFASSTTSFYNDFDKTMLSHYGMNAANGIYAMAYRVIDVATVPVSSIYAAAIPQLFQRGSTSLKSAAELSRRLLKRTLPFTMLLAVVMFAMAPLIPRVLGPQFAESSLALRWLCLIPVFRSVQILSGAALLGAGYQTYLTFAQVIAAGVNFVLNLWWIPVWGWRGAAWSSLLTDAGIGAMNWGLLRLLILRESRQGLVMTEPLTQQS